MIIISLIALPTSAFLLYIAKTGYTSRFTLIYQMLVIIILLVQISFLILMWYNFSNGWRALYWSIPAVIISIATIIYFIQVVISGFGFYRS